jgi:hypothetical protein
LTVSGDGVAEYGGQEFGLTGNIEDDGGVNGAVVDDGGESVSVSLFRGLVLVGNKSLETALGAVS